eukprot:364615-Chlamydomonas_euryale.AAC.24
MCRGGLSACPRPSSLPSVAPPPPRSGRRYAGVRLQSMSAPVSMWHDVSKRGRAPVGSRTMPVTCSALPPPGETPPSPVEVPSTSLPIEVQHLAEEWMSLDPVDNSRREASAHMQTHICIQGAHPSLRLHVAGQANNTYTKPDHTFAHVWVSGCRHASMHPGIQASKQTARQACSDCNMHVSHCSCAGTPQVEAYAHACTCSASHSDSHSTFSAGMSDANPLPTELLRCMLAAAHVQIEQLLQEGRHDELMQRLGQRLEFGGSGVATYAFGSGAHRECFCKKGRSNRPQSTAWTHAAGAVPTCAPTYSNPSSVRCRCLKNHLHHAYSAVCWCPVGMQMRGRTHRAKAQGTAGLRGVMGAGYNRMNHLVVQQTAQGLLRHVAACAPAMHMRDACTRKQSVWPQDTC